MLYSGCMVRLHMRLTYYDHFPSITSAIETLTNSLSYSAINTAINCSYAILASTQSKR